MTTNHALVHVSTTDFDRWDCDVCTISIIRQPRTSDLEWRIAVERFRSDHGDCTCGSLSGAHRPDCKMCPKEHQ